MLTIIKAERQSYPTDISDEGWEKVKDLFTPELAGQPEKYSYREILNTMLYMAKSGCPWDLIPHDLINKSTSFVYFKRWTSTGLFDQISLRLNMAIRIEHGFDELPSVLIADSQSTKSAGKSKKKAMMGTKKSMALKDISLWISLASSSPSSLPELMFMTPQYFKHLSNKPKTSDNFKEHVK